MIATAFSNFAAACTNGAHSGFLGFPTWYEYLKQTTDPNSGLCTPQLGSLSDIWLIVAAVIEILLRLAAVIAVIFVIYGGFTYITSQAETEATAKAKNMIVNALVGLTIAVMAAAIVSFVAKSIK
ncbi:MAG TPA: hypothetical protein VHB51_00820 [Candidatus Saccharimonadales bacterium]|nr:hypothetical protein [Candidatus Saccharimonadales bacterium]